MAVPSVNLLDLARPCDVSVSVAGQRFTLNASTAFDWLGALGMDMENLSGIMPGLIGDQDIETMAQLMQIHPDYLERWLNAARTALGRAGGRDWWWTLNLCRRALGTWIYTNGLLLRQGVDSRATTFPDWLDACFTLYWHNASEEDRTKLETQLSVPPLGVAVRRSRAEVRKMAEAFQAD